MKNILITIIATLLISLVTIHLVWEWEQTHSEFWILNSEFSLEDLQWSVNEIAQSVSPSVVSIIIAKDFQTYRGDPSGFFYERDERITQQIGGGTGVIISEDGKILTNKHVVADKTAKYIVVTSTGKELEAHVLAGDPITDLAVIQVGQPDEWFTPASFIESTENIQVGDFAIAIGNALTEFENTVTFGVVSWTNRSITTYSRGQTQTLSNLIQTDAAINEGNSGGPLVNLEWKIVGINTATSFQWDSLGFAIPYTQKQVDNALRSIEKTGEIHRAYLGIYSVTLDEWIAETLGLLTSTWAYIPERPDSIIPGSPADEAGLLPGDIIISIDGKDLTSQRQLHGILASKNPDDRILLEVIRERSRENFSVQLWRR